MKTRAIEAPAPPRTKHSAPSTKHYLFSPNGPASRSSASVRGAASGGTSRANHASGAGTLMSICEMTSVRSTSGPRAASDRRRSQRGVPPWKSRVLHREARQPSRVDPPAAVLLLQERRGAAAEVHRDPAARIGAPRARRALGRDATGDERAQRVGPQRHAGQRLDDLVGRRMAEDTPVARQQQRGVAVARDQHEGGRPERRDALEAQSAGREPGEQPSAQLHSAAPARERQLGRPGAHAAARRRGLPVRLVEGGKRRARARRQHDGTGGAGGEQEEPGAGEDAARRGGPDAHRGGPCLRASLILASMAPRSIEAPSPSRAFRQAAMASSTRFSWNSTSPKWSWTTELVVSLPAA